MKCFLIPAFLVLTGPAQADIAADIELVVTTQMEATEDAQRLETLSDQAIANLEPAIENFGATIIDRAAFKAVLLGDTYDELLDTVRRRWVEQYTTHLTPEEIAALARFYRSGAGKAPGADVDKSGELPVDASTTLDGPLGPLVEHFPEMQASFSDLEAQLMATFSDVFALERLNKILAMQDIIAFESEARRQEVTAAIEAYLIDG